MALYRFSSERQLVFSVIAGGLPKLVRFGEKNNFGVANFQTDNPRLAAAIRRHFLYVRGVIKETGDAAKDGNGGEGGKPGFTGLPGIDGGNGGADANGGKGADGGADANGGKGADGGADANGGKGADGGADNVIVAENFTVAKNEVVRRTGVDAAMVKNPALLSKVASEHGLKISYVKK